MELNLLTEKEITELLDGEKLLGTSDYNDVLYSLGRHYYEQSSREWDNNELDRLLWEHDFQNGSLANIIRVSDKFEEGGRWTNIETTVYRIIDTDIYVEIKRELAATEMQEDGWTQYSLVTPKEKTIIVYE